MDYMKLYTDLRTGNLSFNQFMEVLDTVYARGSDSNHTHPYAACALDESHYEIKS